MKAPQSPAQRLGARMGQHKARAQKAVRAGDILTPEIVAKIEAGRNPPETRVTRFTEQQQAFIREFAGNASVYAAAIRAGYNDGGSYARNVLLKNEGVLAEIERLRSQAVAEVGVTRKDITEMLQEAFDVAKLVSEPGSMVAAAREMGKMHGLYAASEVKHTVEGSITMDKLERLSDEDLVKMLDAAKPAPLAERVDSDPLQLEDQTEDES